VSYLPGALTGSVSSVSNRSSLRSIRKRASFNIVVMTTFKTVTGIFPREGAKHQRNNYVCTNTYQATYCLYDNTPDKATCNNKCTEE
jgi:hypothetical protein